jgi:hypothetical protein
LEGAPSRDFFVKENPMGNWEHLQRQMAITRGSLLTVIPPHGVRHRPGIPGPNPKQAQLEMVCNAMAADGNMNVSFIVVEETTSVVNGHFYFMLRFSLSNQEINKRSSSV